MVRSKTLYIVDIDGVMADISHRLGYLQDRDYEQFYDGVNVANDAPIEAFRPFYEQISDKIWKESRTVFVSGRPERLRTITSLWIGNHWPVFEGKVCELYLRKDHDFRPSPIVKGEIVLKHLEHWIDRDTTNIVIIDDDPENVIAMADIAREQAPELTITPIVFGTERLNGFGQSTSS